jgi:drug/metabolite transporter (DMT)-like permease
VIEIGLYAVIVAGGTAGELCLARAMKRVGEVADFRPTALLRTFAAALRVPWLWLGLALLAAFLFALMAMLSIENVSFVVPMTALSYVVGALGSEWFLRERVSLARWIGVLLVCTGVALVAASHG